MGMLKMAEGYDPYNQQMAVHVTAYYEKKLNEAINFHLQELVIEEVKKAINADEEFRKIIKDAVDAAIKQLPLDLMVSTIREEIGKIKEKEEAAQ